MRKQGVKQIILCRRFSIQLSSSTNVSKISELIVFTRLSFKSENHEELFDESFKESCAREDTVTEVDDFS